MNLKYIPEGSVEILDKNLFKIQSGSPDICFR